MRIEHRNINFEDDRGTITDIFVKSPKDHSTIIFTKKGGVRGNHHHKQTIQTDFIVSGRMEIFSKRGSGPVERAELGPHDLVVWEPGEIHSFRALEDTVFVTFNEGLRGGGDYEKDTFRVKVPLHEEYEKQQKE
jgi:dTDP-4-dehydrorhamnose 3,5-epimerase